jgi:3-oxoacyl-(acyl-carrier-protein) synthase
MDETEVVVTGVGLIGSLGTTAIEFKDAWASGATAIRTSLPELARTPLDSAEVAVLPPFDAGARLGGRRMLKYMSDAAVLGCIAAREALQDSDALNRFAPERVGLYAGTGLAAANVQDVSSMIEESIDSDGKFSCRLLGERGLPATNPLLSFKILANMPPCLISIIEGIKGANFIFTPWEGQTAAAIVEGWNAVRTGEVDCALVGAADAAAYPSTFVYLRQSGILGEDEFPASGAGYVVMESKTSAKKAEKRVYAVLDNVQTEQTEKPVHDPLAERIGRTFAAAPAMLLGLACMCEWPELSICGVDKQSLRVEMGRA